MDSFFTAAGFIIVTAFLGANVVFAYDRDGYLGLTGTLGLSYLFGIAAVSAELFILGLLGFRFSLFNILVPWILPLAFNIHVWKRLIVRKRVIGPIRFSSAEKTLLLLIIFTAAYAGFRAIIKPIEAYDSVAIWGLKAKVLYFAGTLPADFFKLMDNGFYGAHPDYPLLLPFSEVWFYTFAGKFNDFLVKIIFPVNFAAFLLVFYSFLKTAIGDRRIAVVFTFLLASVRLFNNYATNGYADMSMAIYCSITFIALYLWIRYGKTAYFWTSFVACIAAFWTKNEGNLVLLFMAAISVFHILRAKAKGSKVFVPGISAIAALVIIFGSWSIFKNLSGLDNDVLNWQTLTNHDIPGIFKMTKTILYEYQKQFFGFKYWNLAWILFAVSLFTGYRRVVAGENKYIVMPIFMILLSYTAVYMITPFGVWHVESTISRLIMHVLPLAVFYTALEIKRVASLPGPEESAI